MTEKEIRTRMVQKHDIEENWIKAINFTPKKGELIVYDPDENYDYSRIKIGDGTNTVNELPFVIDKEENIQSDWNQTDTSASDYIKNKPSSLPASDVSAWAKADSKPSYTKSEVGLGNVDNIKQYSASNPPPYPVTSVNGKTGTVTLDTVLYTAQTLTEAQKAQARENVGAVSVDTLFEEATVTHEVKGANILPENMQWTEGYSIKNWDTGITTMNDLYKASDMYTSEIIEVEPGVEYTLVKANGGMSGRSGFGIYDANGVSIKYVKSADGNTFPIPDNGKYIRFTCIAITKSELVSIQPVDKPGQEWVSKVASRTEIVTETVKVDKIQLLEQNMMSRSRFIVFSDIHYNENSSSVSASDERMQLLVDSINAEHAKRTVDFCIFNGDIAIGYMKSSVEAFATKWADKFKMPVFWFPGDHDDVNDANWTKIFGNHRQASLEDQNFYFIWMDVYSDANDDGVESSGVRISSVIDTAWVEQEIAKAGNKPVILMTHYVYADTWYPDICNLLNRYPQIKAVISSHSHNNSVGTIGDNNAAFIQTGNFSYPNGADWTKKGSNNEHLWGFANFETLDGGLYHWYIQPAHNYADISVNMQYTEGEKSLVYAIPNIKTRADINLTKHNELILKEETDPTVPAWAKAANKPSYTKSEIGLGNVENVKQYSANNPPPYPVTSVNGKTGDVILDITVSEANTIPDYWQAELDTGVDAINAVLEQAGRNKSSFLWYHDSHWTDNSKMSPKLLKYLQDNTALNKVNYGGDIVNTETASSRDDWDYIYEWRNAVRSLKNHHSVRGNHEDDIPGLNSDKAKYAFLMAAEETPDIVRGGDFYYYIDDVNEKTRYLYLDTQICTTLTNKGDPLAVQFVVEALNTTPDKWHIVPISHIWFLYDDYNTPKVGQIPDYCQQLFSVFDAYNEKSSSSVTVNGTVVSYDFTNAVGKVEFCIGGHTHVDMDFTTNGGIPVILTEADCYETRGGYSCAPGTIGESAVDGIIADYDAKKISVIRIGRGESREVALGGGINNVLMKSIDSTGAGFNGGKGWADNSRIGQTKVLEEYIGSGNYYVSGYIPIDPTANVTVRMKNISFDQSRTRDIGVVFYGADFMRCDFRYDGSNDDFLAPDRIVLEVMNLSPVLDGTNVVEFTLKASEHLYSGIKYIAICADYIGDDSIITINEPIE